ncbi:TonB-dependent receptor [Chitinophaga agrisoli]|uniref:TonB-dependent receptor n=1 Tax=Chitinophaga agrisoli TaxID=2607653 RepID=A0A5B2VRV9_9BACT|nr:TonB-dependent receptor [Chitinophaga agrisoli]KAA2241755.1 TonB-dependent receptor [Chitinophaga agrisoli]
MLGLASITLANGEEDPLSSIRGKVTTADGLAAPYVTIQVSGTKKGAVTDEKGEFIIRRLNPGTYTLHISLVGFETIDKEVSTQAGQTAKVDFTLQLNDKQLQEIVISGHRNKLATASSDYVNKMPLRNLENPQAYTTVTKELMQEQVVLTVDDAMRNVPGLSRMWEATGRSGDGGSFYSLRGFITQSYLRNGVAGNVSNTIDVANLERVEVLKGPSATLFGNALTSYGGLINRVTKKPYDHFGGEVAYTGGSYGLNRLSADVNVPLDQEKKVLLRLNTAYSSEGSFQDNGFARSFVLAPSVSYKVDDKLSFLLDAEFYHGNNTGLRVFFFPWGLTVKDLGVDRADKLNIDYKRSYANDDLYQTSRNANFFGQMNYRFSDKWSSQTNFTVTNSYSDGPSPYFYLLAGNTSISRNDQFTDNSTDQVIEIQQNFNGDFQLGSLRNRFVGGLDFMYHNSDQIFGGGTFDTVDVTKPIPNYREFNRVNLDKLYQNGGNVFPYLSIYKANTYSAYVSDVLNLTDNLMVLAALRLDHYAYHGSYDPTTGQIGIFDPTTNATSGLPFTQTQLAPKFGIVYQPIKDNISLFANYQSGFTNKAPDPVTGTVFTPEKANQMEAGVKLDLFDGKLSSTLSYYDIKVKDIVRPGGAPNSYIQDGTQFSRGIEAEVIASPIRGMNIVAGFSYNDSKLEKVADKNVEGRRPNTANSPYVANLWISYRIPTGAVKGLGFGFGGNYASDNKIINDAALGVFTLPAYTLVNASLFYDQPKFRISAKVDNIGNEKYWIGYTTVNPQKLRSFAASVALKF